MPSRRITSARVEYRKGALHASHARRAFVRALRAHLPDEAFAELDTIPMERESIERWAKAHRVNAACVIEASRNFFACTMRFRVMALR